MEITDVLEFLENNSVHYEENAGMADFTGFRAGRTCRLLIIPDTKEQLISVVQFLRSNDHEYMLLGNGSNIFFGHDSDKTVILTKKALSDLYLTDDGYIYAGAGVMLADVCRFAAKNSISGFENLYGIPGTVGGAVYMNAGAYGSETKDVIFGVHTLLGRSMREAEITNYDCRFSYRYSMFQESKAPVLGALFQGVPGDRDTIEAAMKECMEKRRSKQPLEYPSCGSAFKRPAGYYAAALIEECGLKGKAVGGAEVSSKHAGFIINRDHATPDDILELFSLVKNTVEEKKGVTLEPEVIIL